jgi:hypothetical protein
VKRVKKETMMKTELPARSAFFKKGFQIEPSWGLHSKQLKKKIVADSSAGLTQTEAVSGNRTPFLSKGASVKGHHNTLLLQVASEASRR